MTVIAMTREIGSRGTEVAAGVAERLGLRIIDSEIVTTGVAGRLGIEEGAVQRRVDGSASLFERWSIDKRKLQRYTSEEILQLVQQGNVLIRGWGAATLLRDFPQVISVRVRAPKVARVQVMMRRLGVEDIDAVRAEIERYDAVYARTLHDFFKIEREDTQLYHISLNTDRVPVEACVNAVCQLASDAKFQDHASHAGLADKLLEIKINAALAEQINLAHAPDGIRALVTGGVVMLFGTTSGGGVSTRAEKIVQDIDATRRVDNQISSTPPRGKGF